RAARLLAEAEEEEESDFAGIGPALDEDEEAVAAGEARVEYRDTPPAPWGPLPVILMVPCVLVLFLVGVMGYELLQGMTAYHKGDKATGMVTSQLVDAVGL